MRAELRCPNCQRVLAKDFDGRYISLTCKRCKRTTAFDYYGRTSQNRGLDRLDKSKYNR